MKGTYGGERWERRVYGRMREPGRWVKSGMDSGCEREWIGAEGRDMSAHVLLVPFIVEGGGGKVTRPYRLGRRGEDDTGTRKIRE